MDFVVFEYDEDSFSIVILYEGKSVGSVSVNFNYIVNLYVEPEMRRRGFGSRLLLQAEAKISSYYDFCFLDSESEELDQERLLVFYDRNGYLVAQSSENEKRFFKKL